MAGGGQGWCVSVLIDKCGWYIVLEKVPSEGS